MDIKELKSLAKELGIKVSNLSSAEKIESSIVEACNGANIEDIKANVNKYKKSEQDEYIEKLANLTFSGAEAKYIKEEERVQAKEATKLVHCMITCNNKNKSSLTGEIFTVRNAVLPEIKKFVSFGVPTHVPAIMLNMIKEKEYQMFRKERLPNGASVTRPFLTKEYNIQELPPLTSEELEAIKQKQLAEGMNN